MQENPNTIIATSNKPLVSVILPTFNRAKLLSRAINSVLKQSYYNLECIVVDDGSIDNTEKVVKSINDNRIVYLKHNYNKHASAARNTGIAKSKGKFIAFLDDDDQWLPKKLEKQISLIQKLPPSVGLIYCWMDYYNNEKLIHKHRPKLRGSVFPMVLDKVEIISIPSHSGVKSKALPIGTILSIPLILFLIIKFFILLKSVP